MEHRIDTTHHLIFNDPYAHLIVNHKSKTSHHFLLNNPFGIYQTPADAFGQLFIVCHSAVVCDVQFPKSAPGNVLIIHCVKGNSDYIRIYP